MATPKVTELTESPHEPVMAITERKESKEQQIRTDQTQGSSVPMKNPANDVVVAALNRKLHHLSKQLDLTHAPEDILAITHALRDVQQTLGYFTNE
jgi:hypothetical protein